MKDLFCTGSHTYNHLKTVNYMQQTMYKQLPTTPKLKNTLILHIEVSAVVRTFKLEKS